MGSQTQTLGSIQPEGQEVGLHIAELKLSMFKGKGHRDNQALASDLFLYCSHTLVLARKDLE